MVAADTADVRAYYATALVGLRYVEERRPTGRRFGAEADSRWGAFRGDLTTADRLDLLLRDADAEWPGAFGARSTFAEVAVAEDDAFGAQWGPLAPVAAEELWRTQLAAAAPKDIPALLASWANAWELTISRVAVGDLAAADMLVLAGPTAIASALEAFAGRDDLSWDNQVTVIATPPAHRQLAALGAAILNTTRPTSLLTAARATTTAAPMGRRIVSPDADGADAAAANRTAG